MEKTMNTLEKRIATIRGEALAASLLANIAIRTALMSSPDPEKLLAAMNAYIEDTLNMSGPAKGDSEDEFNTQMRETARFQALQTLDAIARKIKK